MFSNIINICTGAIEDIAEVAFHKTKLLMCITTCQECIQRGSFRPREQTN